MADIHDIGREAFEIIEQHMVKRSAKTYASQKSRSLQNPHQTIMFRRPQQTSHYVYQPQESLVTHATRVSSSSEATVITGHETSILHDGPVFMDIPRRRPTRMPF